MATRHLNGDSRVSVNYLGVKDTSDSIAGKTRAVLPGKPGLHSIPPPSSMGLRFARPVFLLLCVITPAALIFSVVVFLHATASFPDSLRLKEAASSSPPSSLLHSLGTYLASFSKCGAGEMDVEHKEQTELGLEEQQRKEGLWVVGGYSDEWVPLRVTQCLGLLSSSAPCTKKRHPNSTLVQAEELIYAPFRLRLPEFAVEEHKAWWMDCTRPTERFRFSNDKEWADYPAFLGQNLIFEHTAYVGNPVPDEWSWKSCMGGKESAQSFFQPAAPPFDVDNLVIATSPDSWSFQHFLDRVAIVWAQALLSMNETQRESAAVVAGRDPQPFVKELYSMMGAADHRHGTFRVSARRLVFSCRAPLIHPFTTRRFIDLLGLKPLQVPLSQRKTVLMVPRGTGSEINGGRRILNQEEVNSAVRSLLRERNHGETLAIYKRADYPDIKTLMAFLRDNVLAVVGPHGGALYNIRFASAETLVLEVLPGPGDYCPVVTWESARLLDQGYAAYLGKPQNDKGDMVIEDVNHFVSFLGERLGNKPQDPVVPQHNAPVERRRRR